MPKLRRLSGIDIVAILETFGFEVISIKGSHHKLRRIVDGQKQTLNVPIHALLAIYRQACTYIDEDDLKSHFYTD
jgi:predicted RNA binding protein YcfA (HicA-like mRNA interferase family)